MPLIEPNFSELAQRIQHAAQVHAGAPEEALKMDVEPLLRGALEQQGIQVLPQYEKRTLFRGRQDAVYGQLILEYERPGVLASERGIDHTATQLQGYMEAEASASGTDAATALRRLVGVGLDGEHLFFFRYWPTPLPRSRQRVRALSLFPTQVAPGGFQLLGPFPVDEHSLRELFTYFRSLTRDPLHAGAVAQVFGPDTPLAKQAVGALYAALIGTLPSDAQTFTRQWEFTFGVVYGEDTSDADKDVPELAAAYGLPADSSLKSALLAVHTYFALFMKLLAAELLSLQPGSMTPAFVARLAAADDRTLYRELSDLESGGVFRTLGVENFLEGDFFRWYLGCWSTSLADVTRSIASALSRFEPATPRLTPETTRDLLKRLYQYLVPRRLRHDLGEFYTPDWLAERLLNQLGYDGDPSKRLLDPACGSGTFLTLALSRARTFLERNLLDRDDHALSEHVTSILRNIVGFDLNPLAVIAARTNYLLTLGDLLRAVRPVHIPVYLCDSILTPTQQLREQRSRDAVAVNLFEQEPHYRLPTSVGPFSVPEVVVASGHLPTLTAILEECVAHQYSPEDFGRLVSRELGQYSSNAQGMLVALYERLCELELAKQDGLWARLLRNSFAPVLQGRFDFVAGNPPWVNWESLSREWRDASEEVWERYGLKVRPKGAPRLGAVKRDIAMLFVYVSADMYLKATGRLGFVITPTIFKTVAGTGFRRLQLTRQDGEELYLRMQTVEEMVDLKPFEDAENQTAIMILRVDSLRPTSYPLLYRVWKRAAGDAIPVSAALSEVEAQSRRTDLYARPVLPDDRTTPWMTAPRVVLAALQKVTGPSAYRAFAGICSWLNGVFWVRIVAERPDGLVVVENVPEGGRTPLPTVQRAVERDLLYPMVRGRGVGRWRADASLYVLLTHDPDTRAPISEHTMRTQWRHTFAYLAGFEEQLRRRSGYRQLFTPGVDPYWSLGNISREIMAPHKVLWRQMVADIAACVVGIVDDMVLGSRTTQTQHVVSYIPLHDQEEAAFVAGMMNTSAVRLLNREVLIAKSRGTPRLMDFAAVPRYDPHDHIHRRIMEASQQGMVVSSRGGDLQATVEEIDRLAAGIWRLSDQELRGLRGAVAGDGRSDRDQGGAEAGADADE